MTKILDSTLRDGAYAFGNSMPLIYVNKIALHLDRHIDFLEVGSSLSFGYGMSNALMEDMKRLKAVNNILQHAKSTIFIQPKLWLEIGSPSLSELFSERPGLLRIGIDPELELTIEEELIDQCKINDIPFAINLMKIHKFSFKEIEKICRICGQEADYTNIVDSSGCMGREEIEDVARFLQVNIKSNIGLHIHNNTGMANTLSVNALKNGFCADGTLLGEGRAGGNADTCLLIVKRAQMQNESLEKIDFIMNDLLEATSLIWGSKAREHLINIMLGVTGLHSSKLKTAANSSLEMLPSVRSMSNAAW